MTEKEKATSLYLKLSDACYKFSKMTGYRKTKENREIFNTMCQTIQFLFENSNLKGGA